MKIGPNIKLLPLFVLFAFVCGGTGYYLGYLKGWTAGLADTRQHLEFLQSVVDAGRRPDEPSAVDSVLGEHAGEPIDTTLPEDRKPASH